MGSKGIVDHYNLSKKIKVFWLPDGNHDLTPRKKSGISEAENLKGALAEIIHFVKISSNK